MVYVSSSAPCCLADNTTGNGPLLQTNDAMMLCSVCVLLCCMCVLLCCVCVCAVSMQRFLMLSVVEELIIIIITTVLGVMVATTTTTADAVDANIEIASIKSSEQKFRMYSADEVSAAVGKLPASTLPTAATLDTATTATTGG
eukprot:Lankesteria_metandrocarpae@DN3400_c0_g1_i1.p1